MGNVAIAGNFIARVDHHNAAVQIVRKHSGNLAKCCGFTNTWTPHEQQRLTRIEQIAHHGDGPKNGPSNPTGETNHFPLTISDRTAAQYAKNPKALGVISLARLLQIFVISLSRHECV